MQSEARQLSLAMKLALPSLTKVKLHYPQDNFTYGVNFTIKRIT